MKILFVGPTLRKPDLDGLERCITVAGPAKQGDIAGATSQGVNAIGLVDGLYEDVPAVWHKEILYALSLGVRVYGGASMGALRAAECAPFGMIGVGNIYHDYVCGNLEDDSDVAQLHAPAELGYAPITEALVNVRATLACLLDTGEISAGEHSDLLASAEGMFFKHRTWQEIIGRVFPRDPVRVSELRHAVSRHTVDRKREDALLLLSMLLQGPHERGPSPTGWSLSVTKTWTRLVGSLPLS